LAIPAATRPIPAHESAGSGGRRVRGRRTAFGARRSRAPLSRAGCAGQHALLDHLVGSNHHRLWDRQAERLCSLEVDYQLELGGLSGRSAGLTPLRILSTYIAARLLRAGSEMGAGPVALAVVRTVGTRPNVPPESCVDTGCSHLM